MYIIPRKLDIFRKGKTRVLMTMTHELLKSQCFFISNIRNDSNLSLKHLLNLYQRFLLFFITVKKANLNFLKMKIYQSGPYWTMKTS